MKLSYYNDQFDLKRDDLVYVDGKLEGLQGRVLEINYNFKIKLSDYKKVIAVADTDVKGKFYMAGSHFVTFDRNALPVEKAQTGFKAPANPEEEYASGSDDTFYQLDDLTSLKLPNKIADRGIDYYFKNKVRFLCLDGDRGFAVVKGTHPYELEFEYSDGKISNLVCSCYCRGICKHQVATMVQLRELLRIVDENYGELYNESRYFSAVVKGLFLGMVVEGKEKGCFEV